VERRSQHARKLSYHGHTPGCKRGDFLVAGGRWAPSSAQDLEHVVQALPMGLILVEAVAILRDDSLQQVLASA